MQIEKMDLFNEHKTPIFHLYRQEHNVRYKQCEHRIVIATRLSDFKFQRVFDPYTAYQELVMWLGNQATNEYPPQIRDDKVLRDAKGFDDWSFKNKWSEKKQRRSKK